MRNPQRDGEFAALEPEWSSRDAWKQFLRERMGKQNFMEWIWKKKEQEDRAA